MYSAVSPGFTVCALGEIVNLIFASLPESSATTGVANAGTSENSINETRKILVMPLPAFGSFLRGSMNPGRGGHSKRLWTDAQIILYLQKRMIPHRNWYNLLHCRLDDILLHMQDSPSSRLGLVVCKRSTVLPGFVVENSDNG